MQGQRTHRPGNQVELHHGDGYSALYVNGELEYSGDQPEDALTSYYGVKVVMDDYYSFLGPQQREPYATTVQQKAYLRQCEVDAAKAEQLRVEAMRLSTEADRLAPKKRG